MSEQKEYIFKRIIQRKHSNANIATSGKVIESVKVLQAEIKIIEDQEEICVVLNKDNQELANRLLNQLEKEGNLIFDFITGKWIENYYK